MVHATKTAESSLFAFFEKFLKLVLKAFNPRLCGDRCAEFDICCLFLTQGSECTGCALRGTRNRKKDWRRPCSEAVDTEMIRVDRGRAGRKAYSMRMLATSSVGSAKKEQRSGFTLEF